MTEQFTREQYNTVQEIIEKHLATAKAEIAKDLEALRPQNPFKVGDRVRILEDNAYFTTRVSKGDTAVVTEVLNEDQVYASMEKNTDEWYFRVGIDIEAAPAPEWAVGDRVVANGIFGTITDIDAVCCGTDEITVTLDEPDSNGYEHAYFGLDGESDEEPDTYLESLDERELVKLSRYTDTVLVGDELILADPLGDGYSPIKVGEKVTVTGISWGNLVSAETADGRKTTRYSSRFARA